MTTSLLTAQEVEALEDAIGALESETCALANSKPHPGEQAVHTATIATSDDHVDVLRALVQRSQQPYVAALHVIAGQPRHKQRHEDGYHYVRAYRIRGAWCWALMERVNGRLTRVGTATKHCEVDTFLGAGDAAKVWPQ